MEPSDVCFESKKSPRRFQKKSAIQIKQTYRWLYVEVIILSKRCDFLDAGPQITCIFEILKSFYPLKTL